MLRILSPVFISGVLGWLTLRVFFRPEGLWVRAAFYLALGIPVGAGLFGLFAFLTFLFVRPGTGAILVAFCVPAALAGCLWWLQAAGRLFRPCSLAGPTAQCGPILTIIAILSFGTCLAAGLMLATYFLAYPHGMWDAHAVWNARARVMFRAPDFWRDVFRSDHFHPDYPLTLSFLVFTGWAELGRETQVVPFAVATVFPLASAATAAVGLTVWKSLSWGLVAACLILCSIGYVGLAGAQYADVPLSALLVASVVLFTLAYRNGRVNPPALAAAGMAAGLCGWIKNEGTPVVVGFTLGLLVACLLLHGKRECVRQIGWFWLGAAPVVALLGYYRSFAPPDALLQAATSAGIQEKLLDAHRWTTIAKRYAEESWRAPGTIAPLLLCILFVWLIAGIRVEPALRLPLISGFTALAGIAVSHIAAFLASPYDLTWLLNTAAYRLVLEVMPSFVFLALRKNW